MSISRRNFIKQSSALLALNSINTLGLGQFGISSPKRVALIGTGWYGKSDLFRLMQVAQVDVVGLCDVDKNQLNNAAKLVSARITNTRSLPLFTDHDQMLKEQKPEIVLIGSPDHWHALHTIDSIKAGAHVYLQKPISVDVIEGEAIVAASKKYGRIIQVGTQRRSTPHLIEAKRLFIDSGLIGKVHHVEIFCYYHMLNDGNPALQEVPEFLDYEKWTGPAPLLPYRGLPYLGYWRSFMEYGNGIMGDMCIHMFDAVRWMLGLGWPDRIYSTGGNFMDRKGLANIADTQTATFEYPGLDCIWQHRTWGTSPDPEYPWGFKIYGTNGTLCGSPYKYDYLPVSNEIKKSAEAVYEREKFPEDVKEAGIEIHAAPATRAHFKNFLEAIDNGTKPIANIDEAHISTASCLLANISMKIGRPLSYDPEKRMIKGDQEATSLLKRKYREGYIHPDPTNV